MYRPGNVLDQPADHRKRHRAVNARTVVFVGGNPSILVKPDNSSWRVVNV
jgi:hypothetical protein